MRYINRLNPATIITIVTATLNIASCPSSRGVYGEVVGVDSGEAVGGFGSGEGVGEVGIGETVATELAVSFSVFMIQTAE